MESFPRTHPWVVLTIVTLVLVAALPASAQARNTERNSPQAVLHIRVNVVSFVMSPPPAEPEKPLAGGVTYNVPTHKSNVEIIEEMRPLAVPTFDKAAGSEGAVLRTVTIIAR